MIKKKLVAIMTSVFCVAALIPAVPAMADGQKVVTLGADLSEEQQTMMLKYFGVYGEGVETLYINNTEEREHLAAYVPIEQIGTRTVSCAMVNPTTSGGIQVRTANLTWVTGNMIASTLSTSGVVNCEVLAAAPFPVSGTGALTGIMMAYEAASGESLDEEKKDAATQELVTTATIAGEVGQETATQIVNEVKIEVIEGDVVGTEEIQGIVEDTLQDMEVSLSQEDRDLLVGLMDTLSGLDYGDEEVDAMKDNLDRDEQDGSSDADISSDNDEDSDASSGSDSILDNVDTSALGDDVVESSTIEDEKQNTEDESDENEAPFDITTSDTYGEDEGTTEGEPDDSQEIPNDEETPDGSEELPNDEETPDGTGEIPNDEETPDGSEELPDEEDTTDVTEEAQNGEEGTIVDETGVFSVSELNLIPNTNKGGIGLEEAASELIPDIAEGETESGNAAPGLNYLTVQSSMTGLVPGTGDITLYKTENDELIDTIRMDDNAARVVSEVITDQETLKDLGWSEGIEFRIILSDPLEPGTSYYVVLSDDAFRTEDGTLSLSASEPDDWTFETAAYGISVEETVDGVKADVPAVVNLYMDSDADYAEVECILPDGSVMDAGEYTEECSFEVIFPQTGQTTVKVSYYSAAEETAEEEPEVPDESDDFIEFEDVEEFAAPISEAEYTVNVR